MKFGRNYRLVIQLNSQTEAIVIEPPLTIHFDIVRNTMASLNSMRLQIYNLSLKTRNLLFKDRFNTKLYNKIALQAGYDTLSTVFAGDVFQSNSYRQGSDIITEIEGLDGWFDVSNAKTYKTLAAGTSKADIVDSIFADFPNLKKGKIGEIEGAVRRPVVLNGNSFYLIQRYAENKAYIDYETVNILSDREVIDGEVVLINSDTGLIGTPKRQNSYLEITTIFEPRVIMGQVIQIESSVNPQFDGQYKVIGVHHSGIISEAVSGQCTSTFQLLVGSQLFGEFTKV